MLTASDRGSVTLETVLVIPFVVMLAWSLVTLALVLHEVLVAHDVARAAARVAATTNDDDQVVAEAARLLPASLVAQHVDVEPGRRTPGQIVTVRLTLVREVAGIELGFEVTGRSVAEPVVAWH